MILWHPASIRSGWLAWLAWPVILSMCKTVFKRKKKKYEVFDRAVTGLSPFQNLAKHSSQPMDRGPLMGLQHRDNGPLNCVIYTGKKLNAESVSRLKLSLKHVKNIINIIYIFFNFVIFVIYWYKYLIRIQKTELIFLFTILCVSFKI